MPQAMVSFVSNSGTISLGSHYYLGIQWHKQQTENPLFTDSAYAFLLVLAVCIPCKPILGLSKAFLISDISRYFLAYLFVLLTFLGTSNK
ncbi:MAG: hypothetical protein R2932_25835 [Caldilineaceae bacterium]